MENLTLRDCHQDSNGRPFVFVQLPRKDLRPVLEKMHPGEASNAPLSFRPKTEAYHRQRASRGTNSTSSFGNQEQTLRG